jgi:hypothetical protein
MRWKISIYVQLIFRRIFLSNCWLQKSDIWSQVSYRYTILWVAFLDPSDSYFTIWGTYMKLVTKYQIPVINSCREKCDEKLAYMFNVYKNQQSRQTGSRNLTGPKTLPTIWYTYMMLVTKYLPKSPKQLKMFEKSRNKRLSSSFFRCPLKSVLILLPFLMTFALHESCTRKTLLGPLLNNFI